MSDALEGFDMAVLEEAWEPTIPLPKLAKNIAGQRFTRLVAFRPVAQDRHRKVIWQCICDCGNWVRVIGADLTSGKTKSCGCLNREEASRRAMTHGMKGTPIYRVWQGMLTRCLNPKAVNYGNYGERGISVCPEWQTSFDNFHSYVSQLPHFGEYGYSLDRIDTYGNYEPGNVQWATRTAQAQNKRSSVTITFDGRQQSAVEWAKEIGISPVTLRWRIRSGWSIEDALAPGRKSNHVR